MIARSNKVKGWAEGEDGLFPIFDLMEKHLVHDWFTAENTEEREALWYRITNLNMLRESIKHAISIGANAQKEIDHKDQIERERKARE